MEVWTRPYLELLKARIRCQPNSKTRTRFIAIQISKSIVASVAVTNNLKLSIISTALIKRYRVPQGAVRCTRIYIIASKHF